MDAFETFFSTGDDLDMAAVANAGFVSVVLPEMLGDKELFDMAKTLGTNSLNIWDHQWQVPPNCQRAVSISRAPKAYFDVSH